MPRTLLLTTGSLQGDTVLARRARLRDRAAARLRGSSLDAELARGVAPDASAALVLRAQRLLAPDLRRSLARGLHVVLRDAAAGRRRFSAVPLQRAVILGAAPELGSLANRLVAPAPVDARGVAAVRLLLTEA